MELLRLLLFTLWVVVVVLYRYNISILFKNYKCYVKIIKYINVFHFYLLRFQDLNVIIAKSFKKPMEN